MNWVQTVTTVVHVLLAAAIIGLVLLQRGRGADAGAGFGAGASGTVFGARGSASFLSRMTATMAALFFMTSLALAFLGGQHRAAGPVSVVDTVPQPTVPAEAPADAAQAPAPQPAAEAAPTTAAPAEDQGTAAPAAGTEPQPQPQN